MNQENKIGLVLSGGGFRGAAHIGVIKAMNERNIVPSFISGTSAGAIIGALYAAGYEWQDMYKFLKSIDIFNFKNYTFNKAGILDSDKYAKLFQNKFPDNRFEALEIPLFIATTDLIEAKTRFYFEGELIPPLVASASLPGIFSPVKFNNRLLCDGGVTNNLPVEPLISFSDKIIGVYVNPLQEMAPSNLTSTRSVLERAYLIMRNSISQENLNKCDILIAPEALNNFNILSKSKIKYIFQLGYEEACKKLDAYLEEEGKF
ncbi:patatin [Flavobacteriaceae bacterium Ap0902]|nr:patatin [Flavobacteriaceae bacterium Ap0902]